MLSSTGISKGVKNGSLIGKVSAYGLSDLLRPAMAAKVNRNVQGKDYGTQIDVILMMVYTIRIGGKIKTGIIIKSV